MRSVHAFVLALGLSSCGDPGVDPGDIGRSPDDVAAVQAEASLAACRQVSATGIGHACEHAQGGPFRTVTAVREGTAPVIGDVHTLYTVNLASLGDGRFGGRVTLSLSESGALAFFTAAAAPRFTLRDGTTEIAWQCASEITTCARLRRVRIANVPAGRTLTLEFAPGMATRAQIAVEEVE